MGLTHRDLYKAYLSWPEKILESLGRAPENCEHTGRGLTKILVAGIGGSGAPGRILEAYSILRGSPPYVWSIGGAYIDPRLDYEGALAICVSYSGTTLETILVLEKLMARGARVGVVTSGGDMLGLAERRRLPIYRLTPGSLPRLELPSMLAGIARLSQCLGAPMGVEEGLREASSILGDERKNIEDLGESMAEAISGALSAGKRVVIASTHPYYPVVHRFRSELSENASIPSEPLELPEMGHNQVASLRSGRGSLVILVVDRDRDEDLAVEGYFKRFSEIYQEVETLPISPPQGAGYLAKALYISMAAGVASTLLGMDRGLDPVRIPEIRLFRDTLYSYYVSSLHR